MNSRTALSSTKDLMRSCVGPDNPISSSSDMCRDATPMRASEVEVIPEAIDLWAAKDGTNATAHDEEDKMPARKRMERFMCAA